MSVHGTSRTSGDVRLESASGPKRTLIRSLLPIARFYEYTSSRKGRVLPQNDDLTLLPPGTTPKAPLFSVGLGKQQLGWRPFALVSVRRCRAHSTSSSGASVVSIAIIDNAT